MKTRTSLRSEASGKITTLTFLASLGTTEEMSKNLKNWFNETWLPKNQIWEQVWLVRNGEQVEQRVEEHSYSDSFCGPVEISWSSNTITFILQIPCGATYWRDWLAIKIGPSIKKRFPKLKLKTINVTSTT